MVGWESLGRAQLEEMRRTIIAALALRKPQSEIAEDVAKRFGLRKSMSLSREISSLAKHLERLLHS